MLLPNSDQKTKMTTLIRWRTFTLAAATAWETLGADATANMRAVVAAVTDETRRNSEIVGDERKPTVGDIGVNESAAWDFSCSIELQQSSRIDVSRNDDIFKEGAAVGEQLSVRKNDTKCSQNCKIALMMLLLSTLKSF